MTLIYFVLILGITICIHEFGHFIFAKKAGVHVYEFSLGMGPLLKQWERKDDETVYSIRLFPIGGYVSMAGEEVDEDKKIPAKKRLYNKSWGQRFMTIVAGVLFNFILAIVIFFFLGLVSGTPSKHAYISDLEEGMPAYSSGLKVGDKIVKMNGKNIDADMLLLELMVNGKEEVTLTIEHEDNKREDIVMTPKKQEDDTYKYGFGITTKPVGLPPAPGG